MVYTGIYFDNFINLCLIIKENDRLKIRFNPNNRKKRLNSEINIPVVKNNKNSYVNK